MTRADVLTAADEILRRAGLEGSFVVEDLDTGARLEIEPDRELPSASLVKVPLALATLERIRRGELDPAAPIRLLPGRLEGMAPGPVIFRHPATMALEDVVAMSTALSDGVAADALFELTPPEAVSAFLERIGVPGFTIRHRIDLLRRTPFDHLAEEDRRLALELASTSAGDVLRQLDPSRANTVSARAFGDLLREIWRPSRLHADVAAATRELLAANVHRQRLAPEFASDASRWSSKTGTLLNLRHEGGVVEHASGDTLLVVALTRSSVPAASQPAAEMAMGEVARLLHDELRRG